MALSDLDVKEGFTGNGVATSFAIPFADSYWSTDEIVVIRRTIDDDGEAQEEVLVEGALQDYTLTGASPPTTPLPTTVRFNAAPTAEHTIFIVRVLALIQAYTFTGNSVNPRTLTTALDKLLARIQQIDEANDRSPKLDITSTADPLSMADPEAGAVLKYSDDGTRIENGPTVAEIEAAEGYAEAAAQSASDALDSEEAAEAAAAAAIAASGAVNVEGTPAVPVDVVAATGIIFTDTTHHNTKYVRGSGGPVDITKNPQIQAGTVIGQRLRLIGCSDVNLLTLEDGTGLKLNGTCILGAYNVLDLEWDGTSFWVETSRSA